MDKDDSLSGVVDPEVRAFVYSLVSALGGTGSDEDGRYVLGDDALACLKDLKRWLKLYDEKANRLDVARCLAEANLVNGDLLEILAAWPEEATEDKTKSKIALACLELLVPLTWPIEKNEHHMTVNHHRHIPYLQLAQISYKRGILEHDSSHILRTVVRIGLPSIALPMIERASRDEGIIKLLLYFFRNVALISPPPHLPIEFDASEVSRSATIEAFHYQDVLALLLTIASNMGEDFNTQDVVVMEVLFHLLKGVNIEKLFMDETQLDAKKADELQYLLKKEAGMHRSYAKYAPTRHNRFGTMIWVKRDDARVSTVSGQDVLANSQHTLSKMDQSKKWNKPKQRGKDTERTHNHFDLQVPLSVSANKHLRAFVEEFLDSGFNPLFSHVRRAIEREADRVLDVHSQQFFYLVSWFLEAERVRRRTKSELDRKRKQNMEDLFEPDSFALVASVLNQETFITLNRFMQARLDLKLWQEVNAAVRCFTQILLTVQEMSESPFGDDQEIAENIQNRIFYEETTHDRIIAMLRGYQDQGFSYLDACTELAHVFLRMLERYSKENIDLQVRSKRRARKKKKAANHENENPNQGLEQDSEEEDVAEAHRLSKERKFDFTRFSSKFLTQSCINTFVAFTTYFKDLSAEQLKRAHRFFYRVAFKQEMSVMLFRLDIIALFNKMIKGPEGLDPSNHMFKEWDELTRQLNRRMVKKIQQRPELAVEILFSKINSTVFYLEYGYEKQTITSKPRPPAELEVKGAMTRDEQIGVAVAVLHETKLDAVDWVKHVLSSAINERRSWEAESSARAILDRTEVEHVEETAPEVSSAPSIIVKPDSEERRIAMFKDNKLRLLMALAGFERIGIDDEPDATWIIPSALTSNMLQETHDVIESHRNNPVMTYDDEDPLTAEEMLRRKSTTIARRAEFDDDSDGDGIASNGEEEFLFPAGGPTNRKIDALAELKKKRRKRRVESGDDEGGLDEETLEARRKARQLAELERRRKIKSEEFVHDSDEQEDDERDREFFASEERLRERHAMQVIETLRTRKVDLEAAGGSLKRKKQRNEGMAIASGKKRKVSDPKKGSEDDEPLFASANSSSPAPDNHLDTTDDEATDTPLSSPHTISSQVNSQADPWQRQSPTREVVGSKVSALALDDDDDDGPVIAVGRRRPRAAMLSDSDSE